MLPGIRIENEMCCRWVLNLYFYLMMTSSVKCHTPFPYFSFQTGRLRLSLHNAFCHTIPNKAIPSPKRQYQSQLQIPQRPLFFHDHTSYSITLPSLGKNFSSSHCETQAAYPGCSTFISHFLFRAISKSDEKEPTHLPQTLHLTVPRHCINYPFRLRLCRQGNSFHLPSAWLRATG